MSAPLAIVHADGFVTHLIERDRLSNLSAERALRIHRETLDRMANVLLKLGLLSEADFAAEVATCVKIRTFRGLDSRIT